jgi:hypothetical protein
LHEKTRDEAELGEFDGAFSNLFIHLAKDAARPSQCSPRTCADHQALRLAFAG